MRRVRSTSVCACFHAPRRTGAACHQFLLQVLPSSQGVLSKAHPDCDPTTPQALGAAYGHPLAALTTGEHHAMCCPAPRYKKLVRSPDLLALQSPRSTSALGQLASLFFTSDKVSPVIRALFLLKVPQTSVVQRAVDTAPIVRPTRKFNSHHTPGMR